MTEALAGGTAWQRELYRHLTQHAETERGLLDAYDRAAIESESPAFRYLVSIILADERRQRATHQQPPSARRAARAQVRVLRPRRTLPPQATDLTPTLAAHLYPSTADTPWVVVPSLLSARGREPGLAASLVRPPYHVAPAGAEAGQAQAQAS